MCVYEFVIYINIFLKSSEKKSGGESDKSIKEHSVSHPKVNNPCGHNNSDFFYILFLCVFQYFHACRRLCEIQPVNCCRIYVPNTVHILCSLIYHFFFSCTTRTVCIEIIQLCSTK